MVEYGIKSIFKMYKILFSISFLICITRHSIAQGIPADTLKRLPRINNAYGIRIGIGFRDGDPMMKPIFNPYFEVPLGEIFFSAEVDLSFIDINTLNVFQSDNLRLDAYGWAGKIRWYYNRTLPNRFFSSVGFGMTVHPNTVSAEIPFSSGYLWELSKSTEFEGLVNFTALDYLGQKFGWFISATIGLRFLYL